MQTGCVDFDFAEKLMNAASICKILNVEPLFMVVSFLPFNIVIFVNMLDCTCLR